MSGIMTTEDVCPPYWVSALRGLRNGIYYAGKIRFTHALAMTIVFKTGPLKDKIENVLQLTYEHARNLGLFVFLYKSIIYLLTRLRGRKSKYDSFIGGFIAGYIVFKKKTSVNYQIVLYLMSRIIVGGAENLAKRKKLPNVNAYPLLAGLVNAVIMVLFEDDPSCIQSSLAASMKFLYKGGDTYKSWVDFVPFDVPEFLVKVINALMLSLRKK